MSPIPIDNFLQNPSHGGTPVALTPTINTSAFDRLVARDWDKFESFWAERAHMRIPLYGVEIIFNASIYLRGRGTLQPNIDNSRHLFANFEGPEWDNFKKDVQEIADFTGIFPVTIQNARQQLPNLVLVINPNLPKPGDNSHRNRGGKWSNL